MSYSMMQCRIKNKSRAGLEVLTLIALLFFSNASAANLPAKWIRRSPDPKLKPLRAVHHANGHWVAVGDGGTIATSIDGLVWKSRDSPTSDPLIDVFHGNKQWVAVGRKTVVTSLDGKSWNVVAQLDGLNAVYYGNGWWIAVGDKMYRSENGEIWETIELGSGSLTDVIFAADRWVALESGGRMYVSEDGLSWDNYPLPFRTSAFKGTINSVSYGAGRWVMTSTESRSIYSSPDLNDWTPFSVPSHTGVTGFYPLNVHWAQSMWHVVGGSSLILSSPTGLDWRLLRWQNAQGGSYTFNDIHYADGRWVVVGADRESREGPKRAYILSSSNGEIWTRAGTYVDGSRIAYGNGRWVTASNLQLASSPDGRAWSELVLGGGGQIEGMAFGDGIWIITDGSAFPFISDDGITWFRIEIPGARGIGGAICYANGRWVVGDSSGQIFTSIDGIFWSREFEQSGIQFWSVLFDGNRWLAFGSSLVGQEPFLEDHPHLYFSETGKEWKELETNLPVGNTSVPTRAVFGGGIYMVILGHGAGSIYSSTDAVTWKRHSLRSFSVQSVRYGNGTWIAVDTNGNIIASLDGDAWRTVYRDPNETFHDVAFGDFSWMVVGQGGTVLESFVGPTLSYVVVDNQVTLVWPIKPGDLFLESSEVASGEFKPVEFRPSIVDGRFQVTIPTDKEKRFFRLRRDILEDE